MGRRNENVPFHAVLTCAQMSNADAMTIENGIATGAQLMENAGAAIVNVIRREFSDARRILVLCGPGNNGGDGYVIARLLADGGQEVCLYAFGTPRPGSDGEGAAARWCGTVQQLCAFDPQPDDLVVDAIFGAGLRNHLPTEIEETLARASSSLAPMIAVDLPSGVVGDTGEVLCAARYAATVTFHRKKPGHLIMPGREVCNRVHVTDIGISADLGDAFHADLFENVPALWRNFWPDLCVNTHKYARGHVAVISGKGWSGSAARMSAMAAQRGGAGAVTLLGEHHALDLHAAHTSSIMLKLLDAENTGAQIASLNKVGAVVLGPGFEDHALARAIALDVLAQGDIVDVKTLVLDADGINAFADDPAPLFEAAHKKHEPALVLTPHHGEFARLFPDIAADHSLGKLQKAQVAAERAHAVVVYKGPDTVIATPRSYGLDEPMAAINTNGTPALATAGSGDVLAGIIASLIAQRMPAFYAACAAVWLHGEAGRAAGPVCIAEDLLYQLPIVIKQMISVPSSR